MAKVVFLFNVLINKIWPTKKCGEHNFKKLAYDKSPEWENNNEHHYTWGERNVLWETVAAGTIAESLFSLSSPVPGEGNEGGEVPDL